MTSVATICTRCGTPLDSLTLDGLCPRCVALDFFVPAPPDETNTESSMFGESERRMGDYELLEEIARGGMGVVYRARQISLGREVAVKLLLHGVLAGDTAIARFKAEAAAVANLRHPNVVAIHEIGEHLGQHFFSMEFVAGRTLADKVRDGSLPAKLAATYLQKVAEAVHHAHEHGVLHRDLKPSNVLVDENDQPRVTDFGLAKRADADSDLTLTGQVLGTPAYMSPEQAGGGKFGAVDARSDIYSLGAVLYHLVTGRPPFTGEAVTEILHQVTDIEPVAPHLLVPKLPRDLETICLKCLAKEPSGRYATAQMLADDLGRFLRGEIITARPAGPLEKIWRWCRREPALATALGACAAILVAGVAGILWQLKQTEAARQQAVQEAKNEAIQRQRAEQSDLATRQNLYAADMMGVQRAIEQNDFGSAQTLLESHRPKAGQLDLRGFEWRFFWQQARGDSFAVSSNFNHEITSIAYSRDGKWLAFGTLEVIVVDARTLRVCARVLTGSGVESLAFSPDARSLFIGSRQTQVYRWDWANKPNADLFFDAHGQWPKITLSAAGDIMAVGCDTDRYGGHDGFTGIYDVATGSLRHLLPEAGGCLAFSSDGKLLATGSWRDSIKLWNPARGELLGILTNTPKVVSLEFSPDAKFLAVCDCSGLDGVWLCDLTTRTKTRVATGHDKTVWETAFSPNGSHLATASSDQTVREWDLKTGQECARFHGHSYTVSKVTYSPDGRVIATGGDVVRLWHSTGTGEATNQLMSREDGAIALTVPSGLSLPNLAGNGKFLAAARADGRTAVLKFSDWNPTPVCQLDGQPLGFSEHGNIFSTLTPSTNKEAAQMVEQWLVPGFKRAQKFPLAKSSQQLSSATLSPDGKRLTVDAGAGNVLVWNLADKGEPLTLHMDDANPVRALAWSLDGKQLAVAFNGYNTKATLIHLWNLASSPTHRIFREPSATVSNILFSNEGDKLICGCSDRRIVIWDVASGKETDALIGHPVGISALALSPDGRTLASAAFSDSIRLWNMATSREVARFALGSKESINHLAFEPDGRSLSGVLSTVGTAETKMLVWCAPNFAETDAPGTP